MYSHFLSIKSVYNLLVHTINSTSLIHGVCISILNSNFYAVPIPTVAVTAPETRTVGDPLTLMCNVTAVRGITSDVVVIWRRDGAEVERTEGVNVSYTTANSVVYTDTYTILLLRTTDDGGEYQCEVIINTGPPVMATGNLMLDAMGK